MSVPQNQIGPQSGQPQTHPTVPYGLAAGMGPDPRTEVHQAPPIAQPNQSVQQPAPAPAMLGPDTVLDGPNVPPELRGRKLGQVMQIYSALAEDWMRRNNFNASGGSVPIARETQQAQFQPAPQVAGGGNQGAAPQPPAQTQPYGRTPSQPQGQATQDWRAEIRNIVQETVAPLVAPVIQSTQAAEITKARDIARMNIPDFAELEGDIVQVLTVAPPQSLTNPAVWESAADMIRGKRARNGQPQQNFNQQPQALRPNVPTYNPPAPHTFFTEAPTPPVVRNMPGQLTAEERFYAQRMGMSEQEYIGWRGGVIR